MAPRREEGAALIFTLGTLTLLMSLGSAYVLNMLGENRQTEQFVRALHARLAAQGGVERAVAELRRQARTEFVSHAGQPWYWKSAAQPSYARAGANDSGALSAGSVYSLNIADLSRQIHVNDGNAKLNVLLEGLPGVGNTLAGRICAARQGASRWLPGGRYMAKGQLKKVRGLGGGIFDSIQGHVAVAGYQDPNTTDLSGDAPRSPININTASRDVLIAVLEPMLSNRSEAGRVADDLLAWQDRGGLSPIVMGSWADYGNWLSALRARVPSVSAAEIKNLRDSVNPNRRHAWAKASAAVPAAKYSTEFCFHSGGWYEIQSAGSVRGHAGQALATVTVTVMAQIFKIFNQTKRAHFQAGDRNGNGVFDNGEFRNLTWADDCPVNSLQVAAMGYAPNYDRVNDSLKLGFWDDFEDAAFSAAVWSNRDRRGSSYKIEDSDTSAHAWEAPGDKELHHASGYSGADPRYADSRYGEIELAYAGWRDAADASKSWPAWDFGNAAYSMDVIEDDAALRANPRAGHDDVAHVGFRAHSEGGSLILYQVYARYPGIHYWPAGFQQWQHSSIYQNPLGDDTAWKANASGDPYDKERARDFALGNPGLTRDFWINEDDGSALPRPLIEGAVLATDHSSYKESLIQFPDRVIFVLTARGAPPGTGAERNYYAFGTAPGNAYQYRPRRAYHLTTVNRFNVAGYSPGVCLRLAQELPSGAAEEMAYPEMPALYYGEISTSMRSAGTLVLKNNGSFPSWDNVRVLTPVGEYQSPVIDAGTSNVQWGTLAWTLTIPASASADYEKVSFETKSFTTQADADNNTLDDWPVTVQQVESDDHAREIDGRPIGAGLGLSQGKGRIQQSGSAIVGNYTGNGGPSGRVSVTFPTLAQHGQRYLRYKLWMMSQRYADLPPWTFGGPAPRRVDITLDDAHFLKETPVLEDVTVTYIPRTRIVSVREGV